MNRLYTSLLRPRYHQLRYAIAILVGYGVGGFYLSSCQASVAVWALICLLVAYIATTGTGGIVLSEAAFSLVVITYALAYPWPTTQDVPIPLTPAQLWSGSLLIYWLLGSLLIILLAMAITEFTQQQFSWRYSLFLGGVSFFALNLGHKIYMITAV